jgi:penicillin-binding protein 1A
VPRNVAGEDSSTGMLRLREGLAGSVNGVALRVMADVGPQNVVPWAKQLGITSNLGADLSLALGSYEVSPIEMAGAYATFAGGGVYAKPVLITKIVGPDGKVLTLPPTEAPRKVMDDSEAYVITNLLTSVIDHGTGTRARELRRPVAGKTGTTNQAKDTWFVGYTTDVVCAVWTGYDDPRPLENGAAAGATAALPAWLAFMKDAHEKKPPIDWARPPGVTVVKIDPATGLRAFEGQTNAMDEVFLAGTEPSEIAVPDAGVDGAVTDISDGGVPGSDSIDAGVPILPPATTATPSSTSNTPANLPGLPP